MKKKVITKILALLLKNVIIAILVSLIFGSILCIVYLEFDLNNYWTTLIGGFIGSITVDLFNIKEYFKL